MSINQNLYLHFQNHFPDDRNQLLLVTEEGRQVSYGEADDTSALIATKLKRLGASPGDRVTVQVEKSVANLFLYLGCLRAGLVYHPLNTAYTASELSYFLKDAEPTLVVCAPNSVSLIEGILNERGVHDRSEREVLTLAADGAGTLMDRLTEEIADTCIVVRHGSDMAALLYSSGTTGQPKGIMLSHDNLRKNSETLVSLWGFSSSDRLLHMLPIYHVHGLFVAVSCVLLSGASMSWHSRFSDQAAINAMPRCTVMMGVPTYYTRLLANDTFGSQCCENMRLFISGSAPLLPETFSQFEQRTGHTILERYGMSETGMNSSNPLNGERRAGTVGLPLPDVMVRVVDQNGAAITDGKAGDLQVKGPNVFSGYWRMPEKTAADFTEDGFFNTGDKAVIDAQGYVSIVGRAKDMIITGGLNVYPKEIELVVDAFPGVSESAVVGVADADFGEAVVAVVVLEAEGPTAAEIITHCRAQLANFKVPKRVEFVARLPRNAMGKVQKNILRQHCTELVK